MKALISVKKITALITAFVLVFTLAACNDSQATENSTEEEQTAEIPLPGGSISVPYTSGDSMNPYFMKTVLNSSLISLIYRSLYKINTSFSADKDLAYSENLTGLTLKVYLTEALVFADGSALTPADVVYSFEMAKQSYLYENTLENIDSCKEGEGSSIIFTLGEADVNALNALTFPIVKNKTAESEDFLPVGNGCYQYSQDGIRLSLKANLRYAGELPSVGTVRLTDVKGNTSPENLVSTGELDFYYSDLSDSDITGVNSSVTNVYLNSLVYLGVNHGNVNLVLASFRQAISYAINRPGIVENAYRGFARSTVSPFNISWDKLSSSAAAASMPLGADNVKAASLLGARDFGAGGTAMSLTLVCNEGSSFMRNTASLIAEALLQHNINVDVRLLNSDALENAVAAGEYDLYLAEIKVSPTMDLSQFFSDDGDASYGINFGNCVCDEAYFDYRSGEGTLDEFLYAFASEMPFIPILYRNGRLCYTKNLTSDVVAAEGNIFGNISGWVFTSPGNERN